MAKRPAAAPAAAEGVSERDYQRDINTAIANTEAEIMAAATDDDPLENDADTSLEEMGEGLEGQHLEAEDGEEGEADEVDAAAEGEEGDEPEEGDEASEGDDDEAEDGEAEPAPRAAATDRDQRRPGERDDRRQPVVPAGRLREQTTRARTAEERAELAERSLAQMQGRLDELSRRVNAPAPRQEQQQEQRPDPEPDMFADPEGWKVWNRRQAEQIADERANRVLGSYRQEQQQVREQRINDNMSAAASGSRGFEFQAAYRALTSLDKNDPVAVRMVRGIIDSPDPSAALFDWWEDNGGPEYRDEILTQLMPRQRANSQRQGEPPQPRPRQPQPQPRQVFRGPQPLRSLNSTQGSNSQRTRDPEMLNGSEESVFDFAMRR